MSTAAPATGHSASASAGTRSPFARAGEWLARPPLWVTLVACAVILAARRPDQIFHAQFWAEDTWFFSWARARGLHEFVMAYNGYLHTVPRLMAALAALADPAWAPGIYVGIAFAFTLYVAARTQAARSALPRHAGFALAVVLIPDTFEVFLNGTCLQFVLLIGFLLILLSAEPRRWWEALHDFFFALLFGLTGPFSIVLAPFFLWRAWVRRSAFSIALALTVIVCGVIQFNFVRQSTEPPIDQPVPPTASAALAATGMRLGGSLLAGSQVPMDYPRPVEVTLGLLSLAAVAALAVWRGPRRAERLVLAAVFALLLASTLYRGRLTLPSLCHFAFGSRYFYPLQLILVWLLLLLAIDAPRRAGRTAAVVLVWMLAINVPRLREGPMPDQHWANYVPQLRAGEAVTIPVNPAPWAVPFPAQKTR